MSAIKLAPYVHSLALLGTNLSEAKVNEIPKAGPDKYDNIYLCFDNDAIGVAVKTQLDWVSVLPNMRILGLQKDIKDMTDDEFTVFLERLK
jgi:DNA primase